ncbi:hypothetical protein CMT56_17610 [Elizabethkingia anophelis]|uniref:hypothetical protein n=1 Tax=Elizabethkingia anophelis TaxID=1117645 RepID=UPI0009952617|nr:hypothetical protein [Elizabethkingia anophelis]AQW95065.1 hypothetical protein BBD30_13200 [Elizabethkingia anophelis]MDV2449076.1 hypothetical protein [Elizabethkingia anophelis]MDV3856396.1 hypothetical protein [Elizabethkingia anophelis]MDV3861897.1 hypothetical protein [Elizabethkingia anophelis]MDV3910372.1 hypothetical protein [Elizabethkingia anophelis]
MNKKKYGMPPPQTRYEMEHNFYLALEDFNRKMDSGNKDLIQNALWATGRHLQEVRETPNHRIDVSTINEMMRLQGNMMEWMKYH